MQTPVDMQFDDAAQQRAASGLGMWTFLATEVLFFGAMFMGYIVNRHEYDGNRRTGKMKPGDEHITIEIPALISKTEWDKIQAKRAFNTQKSKRISQARDHWLRDLLVCEEWAGRSSPTPLAGSEKTAQPHVITPASTTRSPPSGLRITTGGGAGSPLSRPRKLKA